jgi:hypothetical protein
MVIMNAFCVLAAQVPAHLIGGMLKNIWDQQLFSKPIGNGSENFLI